MSEQQNAERLNKEIKAQINQLIEMNKIDLKDGDIKYNFTDGTLVKSLYVDALIREQLIKGILAIAIVGESYVVIPRGVANKIAQRDESVIIEQSVFPIFFQKRVANGSEFPIMRIHRHGRRDKASAGSER